MNLTNIENRVNDLSDPGYDRLLSDIELLDDPAPAELIARDDPRPCEQPQTCRLQHRFERGDLAAEFARRMREEEQGDAMGGDRWE